MYQIKQPYNIIRRLAMSHEPDSVFDYALQLFDRAVAYRCWKAPRVTLSM